MKAVIWIIIIVLIIWGIFSLFDKSEPVETGPIKIGVMGPFSGDAAAYGEPMRNIFVLAAQEINDAGGINGNSIELIFEDDICDGAAAASATQKLVNVDKVQVILGSACSGSSLAAVPIAEAGKVMLFSSAASSPDLSGKSKFFARNNPSDSAQGKILAKIALDQGAKSVYALTEQTPYAQGIVRSLASDFSSNGGEVTEENFASSLTDLRQQVTRAKSANLDIFMLSVQTPASGQRILKAMQDLSWKPEILFVNDVVAGDQPTLAMYKDVLEGAYSAEIGVDPENPTFKHALELYKSAYGMDMPFQTYGQSEWDALFLMRDAIEAVGYNGEKIANWLRTDVKDWEGAVGKLTIDSNGDPISGHRTEVIRDGKAVPLE